MPVPGRVSLLGGLVVRLHVTSVPEIVEGLLEEGVQGDGVVSARDDKLTPLVHRSSCRVLDQVSGFRLRPLVDQGTPLTPTGLFLQVMSVGQTRSRVLMPRFMG